MFLHGYFPAILEGLRSTLLVSAVSLAIACVFGLIGAGALFLLWRAAKFSV